MADHVIQLAQTPTARGWAKSIGTSAKDAQVINGFIEVSVNQTLGTKSVYVQKRSGSTTGATYASGVVRLKYYGSLVSAGYATATALYDDSATNLGALSAAVSTNNNYIVAESIVGSKGISSFVTQDGAGWFIYSDATSSNFPTFSGDRTSGSAVISGIASTTGIYPGQAVSGTGIPADTRVASVDSGTQITLNKNATSGSGTATTITKEAVSKIIDAQFPTANSMASMDGYFFAGTSTGTIYQSAINDPSSWASSDVTNADLSGDGCNFIFRHQNHIVAAGSVGTIQYFYNNGNSSGSILSAAKNLSVSGINLLNQPVPFHDGSYCLAATASDTLAGARRNLGLFRLTGTNTYQQISDSMVSGVLLDEVLFNIGVAEIGNKSVVLVHSATDTNVVCYDPTVSAFTLLSMDAAITSSFGAQFTKAGSSSAFTWALGDTWTDSSSAYTLTIQTEPQEMAGGKSTTDSQAILLAGTEASGAASLEITDDDYQNWVSKGSFDMTAKRKEIWALGWHRGPRAYRIQHSANTNFRGQVLRIKHAPGAN